MDGSQLHRKAAPCVAGQEPAIIGGKTIGLMKSGVEKFGVARYFAIPLEMEGCDMDSKTEPSQALSVVTQALEWAYEHATEAIPGLGVQSAEDLAESHLKSSGGDRDKAIGNLIAWNVAYAGSVGFISNVGGLITLPVSIPANLASVLYIQLRMIAAIAHIRGYSVRDERAKGLCFISLTGASAATALHELGVNLCTKLSTNLIGQISGATLVRINQYVGFRLITKAGSTGLINLTKIVPVVGGLVGGAFDAVVTRAIGAAAKNVFAPIPAEDSTDLVVAPLI